MGSHCWRKKLVLHDHIQVTHLWLEHHRSNAVVLSLHMMGAASFQFIPLLVNLFHCDHLIKVLSASLLHCKVTFFLFIIQNLFCEEVIWDNVNNSFLVRPAFIFFHTFLDPWFPIYSLGYNLLLLLFIWCSNFSHMASGNSFNDGVNLPIILGTLP